MVRRYSYICILLLAMLPLFACSEIRPMTIPPYNPPDYSSISRPQIESLVEGQDYMIDEQANRVTFTISGLNKVVAKTISEHTAWQIIEMLKQTIQVQGEIIKQKDQLLIAVDLQRQYAEKGRTSAEVKMYISEVIGLILTITALVAK